MHKPIKKIFSILALAAVVFSSMPVFADVNVTIDNGKKIISANGEKIISANGEKTISDDDEKTIISTGRYDCILEHQLEPVKVATIPQGGVYDCILEYQPSEYEISNYDSYLSKYIYEISNYDSSYLSKYIEVKLKEIRESIFSGKPSSTSHVIKPQTTTAKAEPTTEVTTTKAEPTTETTTNNVYSQYVYRVVELTNARRAEHGLKPLELNDGLCKSAQGHAEDMYKNNYFSHTSPDGRNVKDRVEECTKEFSGYIGENIAYGYPTPEAVVEGWMDSQGHRENILNTDYTHIGVGYSNGYWVQNFAK